MNGEIITFLNSDLLEKYLIGNTTLEENVTVEHYISTYPEVKEAYDKLQTNLEIVAKHQAVKAPKDILNKVLVELDEKPVVKLQTTTRKKWYKYTVAASIVAMLFAGTSYLFYKQNKNLNIENQKIADEVFDLRDDIDLQNQKLDEIMRQFKQLNNPETQKYLITGNNRAKDLKTVAYINPIEKISMVDVVSLPPLPEDKCYQIWAQVQDKMVNLGILSETDRQLKNIPYTEDAFALNITIEPKGGNLNASVENTVATIDIK
jgi:anti-sigma-K factor RskA